MWASIMFKGRKKTCILWTRFITLMCMQMNNGKSRRERTRKMLESKMIKPSNLVFANWYFLHIYFEVEDMTREANKS